VLILSYDRYHLEFLDVAHYETAVRAAVRYKVAVNLHIVHTSEDEPEDLLRFVSGIRPLVSVSTTRTIPVGNAAHAANVPMESIVIQTSDDLTRIPRSCGLGNVFIQEDRAVHGCCWSALVPDSPCQLPPPSTNLRRR
jgi:hypothetical protein